MRGNLNFVIYSPVLQAPHLIYVCVLQSARDTACRWLLGLPQTLLWLRHGPRSMLVDGISIDSFIPIFQAHTLAGVGAIPIKVGGTSGILSIFWQHLPCMIYSLASHA